MSCLAFTNLDFEYELAAGENYRPAVALQRVSARWRHLLRLLPRFESARCLDPDELEGEFGRVESLAVWGWTRRTLKLAERLGMVVPVTAELVTRVNDKRFSHALEQRFGIALPGSTLIASLDELEHTVKNCDFDWVLKHPFGVSGRERVLGKRGQLSTAARKWASGQLQSGWSLVFEPWVKKDAEFSLHFDAADESTVFLGVCQLVTDASGAFRGNRLVPGQQAGKAMLETANRVVQAVMDEGYRGPVSIDAFRGRLGQQPIRRPLTEINARYSFGRLALELRRLLPEQTSFLWWHPKGGLPAGASRALPANPAPGLYRLPEQIDPGAASATAVVVAGSPERLAELEARLTDVAPLSS